MAIRSGVGGQFGFGPESTYGTSVAPTKFPDVDSANVKDGSTYVYPGGIAAGRRQPLLTRSVQVGEGGTAHVEMPVWSKQMGLLLQALMGTTVTPVIIGAGPGYTQTHTFADPFGKSLTLQTGLPDLSSGTARPHSLLGAKVTEAEFSVERGGIVQSTWDFVGREFTEATALATATAVTAVPFSWINTDVQIGATVGAAAHIEGIKKATVKFTNPSNVERDYAGNLGKISEPVVNASGEEVISGSIDADYVTKADLWDRFHNHTPFSLVWTSTAGTFTGGTETFKITLPQCIFTGETPDLTPDVINGSLPFVTGYDGTTQPSIVYISQESAI